MNGGEKKFIPLKIKSIAANLKTLTEERYKILSTHFMDAFIKLYEGSFVESLFCVLNAILISGTECAICMDPLFTGNYKIFKSKQGCECICLIS